MFHHQGNLASFCKPQFSGILWQQSSSDLPWPSWTLSLHSAQAACPHGVLVQRSAHCHIICVAVVPTRCVPLGCLFFSLYIRPQHSAWQIINIEHSEERSGGRHKWVTTACFHGELSTSNAIILDISFNPVFWLSFFRREWAPSTKG